VESFDEAVAILTRLLAEHGRPTPLLWVGNEDVRTVAGRQFVRCPEQNSARADAKMNFERAAAESRAIALDVRGHSGEHSFVVLDIATDQRDAELRMMSSESVKVSIPHVATLQFREIQSGSRWAIVRLLAG